MKIIYTTLFCAALALTGCGDDHDDHSGHGHGDDHAAVEVTNTFIINDWLSGEALEGVQFCYIMDGEDGRTEDCATTGADGKVTFTATVHDGDLLEARADKEGFFSFLVQGAANDPVAGEFETTWLMAATDSLELLTSTLGAELNDDKGHATVVVWGPADAEGVRTPALGAKVETNGTAEFGPEYLNPAEELTTAGPFADPEGGITAGGIASFFNVDPANVDFTVTAEGHVCSPGPASGFASESGTVSGKVEANRVSYFVVVCDVAP